MSIAPLVCAHARIVTLPLLSLFEIGLACRWLC